MTKSTASISLSNAYDAMRDSTHMDEEIVVKTLLENYPENKAQRSETVDLAHAVVTRSRSLKEERGTLDAFMQEFGLTNQEGVALMCLAEALLRIPDSETQDMLIAEKMLSGNWGDHKGNSEDTFVNASVYALMMTGGIINMEKKITLNPVQWFKGLTKRIGEPVIRQATNQAMKIMGRQFVFGRNMTEALKRKGKEPANEQVMSFDMLGEGARTMAHAKRYLELYMESIHAVGKDSANLAPDHRMKSSVSIKLSALHPRYDEANEARVMDELLPDVKALAMTAKSYNMGLTIDAEEAARLDISLRLFEKLAKDSDLEGWDGLGLAVQAYQKRGTCVIDWLIALAEETGRRFPVRLVKGAYWDTEIKHAQEMGYEDYPVFTRKAHTDVSYIIAASKMLDAPTAFYPQFATHNAHSIATIAQLGKGREFEFQRLHGMGDLLYRSAKDVIGDAVHFRTYAPVGAHEDLLPYLVRRLLENGANSSFVNRFMDASVPVDEIVKCPFDVVSSFRNKRHQRIPLPKDIYGDRKNSMGIDLDNPKECEEYLAEIAKHSGTKYKTATLVGGKDTGGDPLDVTSPQKLTNIVGTYRAASEADVDKAFTLATAAQPDWDALGGAKRADILDKLGDLIEENGARLIDIVTREAGKTVPDGISEVREAADFCRYYAKEAREKFEGATRLKGPTGETNDLSLHGRGVFVCISPWNFPLAIFTGQVAAALAAGNTVLTKPALQTPIIAYETVKLMYEAGFPKDVIHLIMGPGSKTGALMTSDERCGGVCFTGSTAVAKIINKTLANKDGVIAPLIAETGGQNAMIMDSSALPEQVTDDAIMSAFGSAGQRCSALRVLYVQDSVADKVIDMLAGALKEQKMGDPKFLNTDIGPIIDASAAKELTEHSQAMEAKHKLLGRAEMPDYCNDGTFVAPTLVEIPSLSALEDENFGPILHVIRYDAKMIDQVMEDILATGYGLTFGVHSRIEGRWLDFFKKHKVGNTYVNRNMIGATVGVQPFGGQGLSGTGPKAGGPRYLYRFATEKTLTINTAAIGGNTDLFKLEEGSGA
jgi:RHH-type proline utilization regulon transcriptional repressor/proline dehydrogenase/delta 1-pyrroline-5-carboxylate dehydrogenase